MMMDCLKGKLVKITVILILSSSILSIKNHVTHIYQSPDNR